VLVADLGGDAEKAGVERGDIVTQVDGKPVATLTEFSHAAAAATDSGDSNVTLTIRRGDAMRVVTLNRRQPGTRG
jgi:S1-C subfamily serine protease